ncbi:host attachment protein [Colwelliaceae bacterium 6471]
MSILILTADSGRARLFQTENSSSEIIEVEDIVNPVARIKDNKLLSDGASSLKDSVGAGRHGGDPKHMPKEVAKQRFAKEVSDTLVASMDKYGYHKLYIIAAPKFLGELRTVIPNKIKQLLIGEVDHDATSLTPKEFRHLLPKYL